jgi:hypothetical protein
MQITIDVEQYTEEKFLDYIAEQVFAKVRGGYEGNDKLDRKVDDLLRELVEKKVAGLVEVVVREKVAEVFAAGVRTGGQYDRSKPKGVEDLIREALETKHGDTFHSSSNAKTIPERVVKEVLEAELRGKFGEQLRQIEKDFKAQVDKVLADRLLAIVRSAQ